MYSFGFRLHHSRALTRSTNAPLYSYVTLLTHPIMVHLRANEHVSNPNLYINFIASLGDAEDAFELLRALAAQVKPIMKNHGLTVNSLEEYEANKVFLGRNWNNGETIELVLRDFTGRFYPTASLLSVFCHELAHIKHMNHSSAFHTLRRQLCAEVFALQRKRYFGDGYWSAGMRLKDSRRIAGAAEMAQEIPEYTCGGAFSQSRREAIPSRPRQSRRRKAGPSMHSGAQTIKQRKAGSRVKSKSAFGSAGEGHVLDISVQKGGEKSTFRKKATSQKAREERALAAERRLLKLQSKNAPELSETLSKHDAEEEDEEISESDYELATAETDRDRLERMRSAVGVDDLDTFRDDDSDITGIEQEEACDESGLGKKADSEPCSKHEDGLIVSKKRHGDALEPDDGDIKHRKTAFPGISGHFTSSTKPKDHFVPSNSRQAESHAKRGPLGNLVKDEIRDRKREVIGLDKSYKLGSGDVRRQVEETWHCDMCTFVNAATVSICGMCESQKKSDYICPGTGH